MARSGLFRPDVAHAGFLQVWREPKDDIHSGACATSGGNFGGHDVAGCRADTGSPRPGRPGHALVTSTARSRVLRRCSKHPGQITRRGWRRTSRGCLTPEPVGFYIEAALAEGHEEAFLDGLASRSLASYIWARAEAARWRGDAGAERRWIEKLGNLQKRASDENGGLYMLWR